MDHGIAGYFVERARCARRVSLLTLLVSAGAAALLLGLRATAVQRALPQAMRFGFEGPEQYVRRITLEQRHGGTSTLADVGQVEPRASTRRGGGKAPTRGEVGQPTPRARFRGPGNADFDVAQRSASRLSGVPVFQSEELIIDRLVKPEYPAVLLARNVEGKVTLQALVDTVGQVVEVEVLASTGETEFETAATEAVWQCRFRPYRAAGQASEVYAVFRFSFRIY